MLNIFIYTLLLAMFLLTERLHFFIVSSLVKGGIFQKGTTRQRTRIQQWRLQQMPVNAEQLRAITTELVEIPAFQETLRILTQGNSMRPPSRIPAPTFSDVEKERASLFHHHRRTATTRNQHQQHRPRLWLSPFSSLTAAARVSFVCL